MAYLTRYAKQPLSEVKAMTLSEALALHEAISWIVKLENARSDDED